MSPSPVTSRKSAGLDAEALGERQRLGQRGGGRHQPCVDDDLEAAPGARRADPRRPLRRPRRTPARTARARRRAPRRGRPVRRSRPARATPAPGRRRSRRRARPPARRGGRPGQRRRCSSGSTPRPARAPRARPRPPRSTAAASASIVTSTRGAFGGLGRRSATRRTPSPASACAFAAVRFHAATSIPARARLRAIGAPMTPVPRKAAVTAVMYTVLVSVKKCTAALPCSREWELERFMPPNGACGSAPAVSELTWTTPTSASRANVQRRGEVAGEQRRGEAVLDRVGDRQRLVERVGAHQPEHRAEDLLLADPRVRRHAVVDRRLHEPAVAVPPAPPPVSSVWPSSRATSR